MQKRNLNTVKPAREVKSNCWARYICTASHCLEESAGHSGHDNMNQKSFRWPLQMYPLGRLTFVVAKQMTNAAVNMLTCFRFVRSVLKRHSGSSEPSPSRN